MATKKTVDQLSEECEELGLDVSAALAPLDDKDKTAFLTGALDRLRGESQSKTAKHARESLPDNDEAEAAYEQGFRYADANTGTGPAMEEPLPTDRERVEVPPDGLVIDAAQRGGSTRGGEENTNPHPGSPTSDRQVKKTAKKSEPARAAREHPGSKGDAQASKAERKARNSD